MPVGGGRGMGGLDLVMRGEWRDEEGRVRRARCGKEERGVANFFEPVSSPCLRFFVHFLRFTGTG